MHVCEYVTPLFCMLNYYFNHFLGNKFLKKTQSNIETDRLYKLLDDQKITRIVTSRWHELYIFTLSLWPWKLRHARAVSIANLVI